MKTDPIYVERSMTTEPQLFRVNPQSRETDRIKEVEFSALGFQERRDIQEWVAANPGVLGEDLLIIAKEFSGFDRTNERLDLLAVDEDGKLVVVELKRDDTGADAHWQAIKYASYLDRVGTDDIIRMLASYRSISKEESAQRLVQHLDADDVNALENLNSDQRIILASHRFAPEVTSAVLWLNEKAPGKNLITCIKLTPYHDATTNSLYIQASTIIPLPGLDDLIVTVGDNALESRPGSGNSFAVNLRKAYARNKGDEVTHFLRRVGDEVTKNLPDEIRPDKISRWAGRSSLDDHRYYHFWYSRPPWGNWDLSYRINLSPTQEEDVWSARIVLRDCPETLANHLITLNLYEVQQIEPKAFMVGMGIDYLESDFGKRIATMTRKLIEKFTPIVDRLEDEGNEEDSRLPQSLVED